MAKRKNNKKKENSVVAGMVKTWGRDKKGYGGRKFEMETQWLFKKTNQKKNCTGWGV